MVSRKDRDAIKTAIFNGQLGVLQLLIDRYFGLRYVPLFPYWSVAASHGHVELLDYLLTRFPQGSEDLGRQIQLLSPSGSSEVIACVEKHGG